MGLFNFGDDRTPYEHGRDDSAEQDPSSFGTFMDDFTTGLDFFADPEYKEGYRDGIDDREEKN